MSLPLQLRDPGYTIGSWDDPGTVRYYEEFCERHDRYTLANTILATRAELFPGARMLDLGAGTGRTAEACLPFLGPEGSVLCVEPARAMREAGMSRTRDPRVAWSEDYDAIQESFDRIVCGAAIWQMLPLETTIRSIHSQLVEGGVLCFNIPSLYLGEADEPGGGNDPLLLQLPFALMSGDSEPAESTSIPDADRFEGLLTAAGFARHRRWTFQVRLTQEALRDWLKIPVLTERLLPGQSPEERVRRIDEAFQRVDPASWRWERWTGWTVWKSGC